MTMIDGKDAATRKAHPVYSGVLKYFPNALLEVARLSKAGNDQHNPGQPLHWSMGKSTDHADCLVRHQLDAGGVDDDGQRHSAKVAWRALAQLEFELLAEAAGMSVEAYVADLQAQERDSMTGKTFPPDAFVGGPVTVGRVDNYYTDLLKPKWTDGPSAKMGDPAGRDKLHDLYREMAAQGRCRGVCALAEVNGIRRGNIVKHKEDGDVGIVSDFDENANIGVIWNHGEFRFAMYYAPEDLVKL